MAQAVLSYTPQTQQEVEYFDELWALASSPGGKLPLTKERGNQFLAQSGLKQQMLDNIWSLATPRNTMDKAQFVTALRLVALAQCTRTIDRAVFERLSRVELAFPVFRSREPPSQHFSFELTPIDLADYQNFFSGKFPSGLMSCEYFRDKLKPLKLQPDVVRRICSWAARDRSGSLNREEFCVAMHLATCIANRGHPAPDELPPSLLRFLPPKPRSVPRQAPSRPEQRAQVETKADPNPEPIFEPEPEPTPQPRRAEEFKQAEPMDADTTRLARFCFLNFATDRARCATDYSGCLNFIGAVKEDRQLREVSNKISEYIDGEKGFIRRVFQSDGNVYWASITEVLQLPSEELSLNQAELTELFCRFAGDEHAALSSNQLSAMFQVAAVPLDGSELALVMMDLDKDGNGSIEIEEFTQALHDDSLTVAHPKITELAQASRAVKLASAMEILTLLFALYDEDKSETLEFAELQTMIRDIGLPLDEAQLFQFLSALDTDGSCQIELDEFVAAVEADCNAIAFDTAHILVQTMLDLRESHIRSTIDTLFTHYDENGNDGLEFPEVQAMFEAAGIPLSSEHMLRLMRELDESGIVDRRKFIAAASDRSKSFARDQVNRLIRRNTDMDTLKRPLRIWFDVPADSSPRLTADQQRQALMTVFNDGGGRNWWSKGGWGSQKPVDQWYGITCRADGMVTKLCFQSTFRGLLSPAIGEILYLKELRLSNVSLTGKIPEQLSRLTNLEKLHLDRNTLTGPLPSTLHRAHKLRALCLNQNRLTGTLPGSITLLCNLQKLHLQSNCFSEGVEVVKQWAQANCLDFAL